VSRFLVIAGSAIILLAVAAVVFISSRQPQVPAESDTFFSTPQDYPTSGGQEMRPRWSTPSEQADNGANN